MSSEAAAKDLRGPLVQEVSLSPGSSPLLTPQVPASDNEEGPRLASVQSTKSVVFDSSAQQESRHRNATTKERVVTHPRSSETVNRTIYWRSPASMIACFFLGVFVALGHHLYYTSLKGDLVGDEDEQQRKLRSVITTPRIYTILLNSMLFVDCVTC